MLLSSSVIAVSSMVLFSSAVFSQDVNSGGAITPDVQTCMTANNCGSDTTCIAKCITSAGPTQQQSKDTLVCFTNCQKLTNAPGVYEACNKDCQTKYFLAPNSSPSSSSGSNSSTYDVNSKGANSNGSDRVFTSAGMILFSVLSMTTLFLL